MKSCRLRPGARVFHRWSHPCSRPNGISDELLQRFLMDGPGILVRIDRTHPFDGSKIPYWCVRVKDGISQWREDLINPCT